MQLDPRALEALKFGQRQLDHDGTEVGVSRQALDELLAYVDHLSALPASDLVERLERAADDPMWDAHAEVPKHWLREAATALRLRDEGWRDMSSAPKDGTIINVVARYPEAISGFPQYAGWRDDLGGGWFAHSKDRPLLVLPWAWRPRESWPVESSRSSTP